MTPPVKSEGVPGRCRARYSMTEPYLDKVDGIVAIQFLLAAQNVMKGRIEVRPIVAVGYYIVFCPLGRIDGLPALSKCGQARVSFRPVPTASSPPNVFGRCIDESSSYDVFVLDHAIRSTSSCWCNPSWGYACRAGGFLGSRSSSFKIRIA
jgi:hypothetical protein